MSITGKQSADGLVYLSCPKSDCGAKLRIKPKSAAHERDLRELRPQVRSRRRGHGYAVRLDPGAAAFAAGSHGRRERFFVPRRRQTGTRRASAAAAEESQATLGRGRRRSATGTPQPSRTGKDHAGWIDRRRRRCCRAICLAASPSAWSMPRATKSKRNRRSPRPQTQHDRRRPFRSHQPSRRQRRTKNHRPRRSRARRSSRSPRCHQKAPR